jgi:hypothetical protein
VYWRGGVREGMKGTRERDRQREREREREGGRQKQRNRGHSANQVTILYETLSNIEEKKM